MKLHLVQTLPQKFLYDVSNLMHFQGEMVNFFLKNEVLRSESVKLLLFVSQVVSNLIYETFHCR